MRKQFKNTVMDLAASDPQVVVILGDISHFLFNDFQTRYPDRFYNMGICENTLISVSAGLNAQGFIPFVHTIAPFITERSFEQIKLDLCYNGFAANIVSCGGSFDYAWDGATHHCYTDIAILRMLPGMDIVQPGSCRELDVLMRSHYRSGHPTYFRLSDNPHSIDVPPVEFGKGVVLKEHAGAGPAVTVITAGPLLPDVLKASEALDVNLLYFPTLKPIDADLIYRYQDTRLLVVHDAFGLYETVCALPGITAVNHGLPDQFCTWYGTVHDIRQKIGLDPAGIRAAIQNRQA